MRFSPARLLQILTDLPQANRILVAFSGGRDSHVLLHALSGLADRLPAPLRAIHVNHGLQSGSDHWSDHCQNVCRKLGVPCEAVDLNLQVQKGQSLEAVAREARYHTLAGRMSRNDLLLTAHHQEDQAETVLLQLLRGAGPSGLSAMPAVTPFGPGYHGRPLLIFSCAELDQYARNNMLSWIEDPSNRDNSIDRNYLRQQVMPLLAARWPAMSRTLSRSARHCAEAQGLIDELAGRDLERLLDSDRGRLSLSRLAGLSPPRGRAVLRAWIKGAGYPIPNTARLDRILGEMVTAGADRNPLVHWPDVEVRRYRNWLCLMLPLTHFDQNQVLSWDGETPLALPGKLGCLSVNESAGGILAEYWRKGRIEVRFGQREGRIRLPGNPSSKRFKHYFQEQGVPPWERGRIPLIYIGGELAAVGELTNCRPFAGPADKMGYQVSWDRPVVSCS